MTSPRRAPARGSRARGCVPRRRGRTRVAAACARRARAMDSTSSGRAGDDADDGAAPGSGRRTDGAEPGDGEAPTRAPSPSPSPGTETATKRPRGDEAPAEGRQKRRASPQASRAADEPVHSQSRGARPRDARVPRPHPARPGPRDRGAARPRGRATACTRVRHSQLWSRLARLLSDSFRLILGRAIISRGVLKERMLFLSTICRDTSNFKRH